MENSTVIPQGPKILYYKCVACPKVYTKLQNAVECCKNIPNTTAIFTTAENPTKFKCIVCNELHQNVENALVCCKGSKIIPAQQQDSKIIPATTQEDTKIIQSYMTSQQPAKIIQPITVQQDTKIIQSFTAQKINPKIMIPSIKRKQDPLSDNFKSHGGLREQIWSKKEVENLINHVKANYERLLNKEEKSQMVWLDIRDEMRKTMPDITAKQVTVKWRSIKRTYVHYEVQKHQQKLRFRRPLYYNLLDSFLKDSKLDSSLLKTEGTETVDNFDMNKKSTGTPKSTGNKFLSLLKQRSINKKSILKSTGKCPDESTAEDQSKESEDLDIETTLLQILNETKRHNQAMEENNVLMRQILSEISSSLSENNRIFREMLN